MANSSDPFPVKTAAVVTATTGNRYLAQCLASVQAQAYPHLEHFVVADGQKFEPAARAAVSQVAHPKYPIHFLSLPHNTGASGYNGYRISVAFSFLINADVLFFLDDDNWWEPDHVAELMAALNDYQVDWGYTLRRICREDGRHFADDNCDSLGYWRRHGSYGAPAEYMPEWFVRFYTVCPFQVDTSCFAMRTSVLTDFAPLLIYKYRGDAVLASKLVRSLPGACVGARTVNYRLRKEQEESIGGYYVDGNQAMKKRYRDKHDPDAPFPWMVRQRCEPYRLEDPPAD